MTCRTARCVHGAYQSRRLSTAGSWRAPCMSEGDMYDPTDRRPVGRRAAARLMVAGVAAAVVTPRALFPLGGASLAPRGAPLRIGFARPRDPNTATWRSLERGVRLGLEETSRAAAMLGRELSLHEGEAHDLLVGGVDAMVGGSAIDGLATGALADAAGVVYLDAFPGTTGTMAAPPRHVFHVAPGEATRRTALARASAAGEVVLWHPALRRYGAAQLNARHRARFDAPMDSHAWAGWMAMKIIWESASRLDRSRGDTLADWLVSSRARFDGHKGRALFFDPATHELRQPLYVVRELAGSEDEIEEILPTEPATSTES